MSPRFSSNYFPDSGVAHSEHSCKGLIGVFSRCVKFSHFKNALINQLHICRPFSIGIGVVSPLIHRVLCVVKVVSGSKVVGIATGTCVNAGVKNHKAVGNIALMMNNPRKFVRGKVKLSVWHSYYHLAIAGGFKTCLPYPAFVLGSFRYF